MTEEDRETIAIRNQLEREVGTNRLIDQLFRERAALRQQLAQVEKERDGYKRQLDSEYKRQGGVGFRP